MTWMPARAAGPVTVQCMTKQITLFLHNLLKFFPTQCDCSVSYNDLQFHIVGHYVDCSMEFMQSQLITYMQTYVSGVKIVGDKHLASKGLAVKDYISYISKENNRGDELSLYLLCRMTQKHACVLGRIQCGTPVALKIKIKTLLWLIAKMF